MTVQSGSGQQARVNHGGPKTSPPTKSKFKGSKGVQSGPKGLTKSQPNG